MTAENPYRERLRGQLMLALYRSGRQAEALEAYREGRRALVDGLGIEPSAALTRLEKQVLNQDERLDLSPRPQPSATAAAPPAPQRAMREQRKVVTILVCDIVDATSSDRSLDPESLRALLARCFERVKETVERHGGHATPRSPTHAKRASCTTNNGREPAPPCCTTRR